MLLQLIVAISILNYEACLAFWILASVSPLQCCCCAFGVGAVVGVAIAVAASACVQCVASCIGSVIQVFSDLLNAVRVVVVSLLLQLQLQLQSHCPLCLPRAQNSEISTMALSTFDS